MKRFLIIGFILALLIATPIVAYIVINQKTTTTTHANPASSLLFEDLTAPVVVGQQFAIKLDVNPSSNGTSNAVSFVKVDISYDGSKLKADNGSLVPSAAFATALEGPTNTCTGTACTISATLSIGPDPTKAVSAQALVATITFTPLAPTDAAAPIKLDFVSGQNQILSLATSDQPAENVFTRGIPASITIVTPDSLSGTPVPTTSTTTGSAPTPTTTSGSGGGGTTTNQPPTCTNLAVTKSTTDATGMTYQLSATGADSDGTISKVTFNFGDGNVQDITSGNTLGTNSVSTSTSHVYTAAGTFTASALMTDNTGAISTPSTCSQTITVVSGSSGTSGSTGSTGSTGSSGSTAQAPTPTPIPNAPQTIPPTGPGDTIIGIGLAGAALVVVGGLFFLGL